MLPQVVAQQTNTPLRHRLQRSKDIKFIMN
jgi:hypothetical protein